MEFPDPKIQEYLFDLTPASPPLLKEMEALAEEERFPAVGPLVGRLLYQLVKISGAKMVFELGSGFGYSALWMALALPDQAQIICTENDPEKARQGLKFLERAGQSHKVLYEVGDAVSTFRRYQGPFDIIFCDLHKEQYPEILKLATSRLKRGGMLIADNVLWSGRMLEGDTSPATRGIQEFNDQLSKSSDLFSTVIPLRDGVSLSIKE